MSALARERAWGGVQSREIGRGVARAMYTEDQHSQVGADSIDMSLQLEKLLFESRKHNLPGGRRPAQCIFAGGRAATKRATVML